MVNKRNIIIGIIMMVIFAIGTFVFYTKGKVAESNMSYQVFVNKLDEGSIKHVTISAQADMRVKIEGDDKTFIVPNPRSESLKEKLLLSGVEVSEGGSFGASTVETGVSMLIFCAVLVIAYKFSRKGASSSTLGMEIIDASKDGGSSVYFSDIAGNTEAKDSVQEIVDFIKSPERFAEFGARMPHGIIFYGPPGTGKTLMAKAVAAEAGVPFYAVSGSDFVQMYVGVGAGRVRELFKTARKSAKAVIFIDEIDALAKKRSATIAGGNDEREQTLNALLTEMSGFNDSDGIVIIAATNRLELLDEALLRPGRFDRQIEINLPDLSGREKILLHHAKNKPVSDEVSIKKLAKQTVYFSGAMLENLLNEAAIAAAKSGRKEISSKDIDTAYYTIIAGSEKKDRQDCKRREQEITAYHEAGHALITRLLCPENTVAKVTIIPSTKGAGGFCVNIPVDKMYYTKKEIESGIMINLAGRAAEEIIFGEENITTGAGNDLQKATKTIGDYITRFGMSKKFGLVSMETLMQEGKISETEVFDECRTHLERLYNETKRVINENISYLETIADMLLDRETIGEEDLEFVTAG